MAKIYTKCKCGYYFTFEIEGEGSVKCPKCRIEFIRFFDPTIEDYDIKIKSDNK